MRFAKKSPLGYQRPPGEEFIQTDLQNYSKSVKRAGEWWALCKAFNHLSGKVTNLRGNCMQVIGCMIFYSLQNRGVPGQLFILVFIF